MADESAINPAEDDAYADEAQAAIAELFEGYRAAFDDYDAEAIADCFAYPAVIWQFGKGNVFADEEELLENIEKLLEALDREEVVRSDFEVLSAHVSGSTALVSLAWTQDNGADESVFEFACHYHLVLDGEDWRIAMIVNET
ncbi:DUF4440 domain-containing protein [Stappia sp. F7233]|uniref:DUF4440 domain-containing protein n=1 Tax=Stappia albiluteola TaxID=2758565 RepID=A0A839AJD7_9HYPH|nr:DUF4440 domain-containing protein [Stappia albiluteola]MBA5779148.1 DUF4440 domain-containing protein [Stappia albiluteola]